MTTRLSDPPTIYKAHGLGPLPDLHLVATEPIPEFESLGAMRAFYAEQGRTIVDALSASLSGGTMDAVLVELLDRKRSLLRILHDAPKAAG
jgi:hypothetical protein